jgi:hypothetical protein
MVCLQPPKAKTTLITITSLMVFLPWQSTIQEMLALAVVLSEAIHLSPREIH